MTISSSFQQFNGTWVKDEKCSESIDPASDLLELSTTVRTIMKKMGPMIIDSDEKCFRSVVKMPKIGYFIPLPSAKEEFPWSGEVAEHKRRDNRSGKFKGNAVPLPDGSGFSIKAEWNDPLSGKNVDTYRLSKDGNVLTLEQNLTVQGNNCVYKTVYNRS